MSSLKSGAGVFQGTLLTELLGCVDFSGVACQGSGSASCAVLLTFPLQQGTPCHGGGGGGGRFAFFVCPFSLLPQFLISQCQQPLFCRTLLFRYALPDVAALSFLGKAGSKCWFSVYRHLDYLLFFSLK